MTTLPRRIADIVHDVLREHLVAGRFPPGTRFAEADLARQFGVSRVPIRAALDRLAADGHLQFGPRRGFVRPGAVDGTAGARRDRPLVPIPADVLDGLASRNSRQRIFDTVQTEIASAMAFGPFGINEKALADHHGVGRSVAREVLNRLERTGLVVQLATGRWRTAAMDAADVHDHYFMRRTLEPMALRLVAPTLEPDALTEQAARLRIFRADAEAVGTRELLLIEGWLHRDIVLRCANRVLANSIERSQLPLISTHVSFVATRSTDSVHQTIDQHLAVLDALIEGKTEAAAAALCSHLQAADRLAAARIRLLTPDYFTDRQPYLVPTDVRSSRKSEAN